METKGIADWTDLDYAQAAIDMLPGTVEEIRTFFVTEEVTGLRCGAQLCPVAIWLARWTGQPMSVGVGAFRFAKSGDRHPIPYVVQQFVSQFDRGEITL